VSRPDRWLHLRIRVPSEDLRPLVAEGLVALGGAAVQEEGEVVSTHLPPPEGGNVEPVLRQARQLAEEVMPGEGAEVEAEWVPDEDWARLWKRGIEPRRVTDRIVVRPTWAEYAGNPGDVVLVIDPQMAFGTGEHATTRGCLRLLDDALRPGDRVLDVGSGSGILAIAAARLGAAEVIAVEADADANLNAHENLALNGVEGQVRLEEGFADAELIARLGTFDTILANILSSVIRPLLPAFRTALRPGGRLIVSGILREESGDVLADAGEAGFRAIAVDEEGEWWSALLEPA
jgi:ribosomal protein L11 methyltransferase